MAMLAIRIAVTKPLLALASNAVALTIVKVMQHCSSHQPFVLPSLLAHPSTRSHISHCAHRPYCYLYQHMCERRNSNAYDYDHNYDSHP